MELPHNQKSQKAREKKTSKTNLNLHPLNKPITPNKPLIIISPHLRPSRNLDTQPLTPRRHARHSLELALDLLDGPGGRDAPLGQEPGFIGFG